MSVHGIETGGSGKDRNGLSYRGAKGTLHGNAQGSKGDVLRDSGTGVRLRESGKMRMIALSMLQKHFQPSVVYVVDVSYHQAFHDVEVFD